MFRPLIRSVLASACVAALAGCATMAPTYTRPVAPVQSGFPQTAGVATSAGAADAAQLDWQAVFLDPKLRQVLALALSNNRDLRIALLNIEAERAQYRIQRADLLPTVGGTVGETAERGNTGTSGDSRSAVSRSYSATVGITSWEVDLFGRVRSLRNEALETWLSTGETQRSTRLTLVAEVASDWLTVAADRAHLALAQQTLESQRHTLTLTEAEHDEGTVSALDLAQIQSTVATARGDVATYVTQLAKDRDALDLVVGAPVTDELLPEPASLDVAVALAAIPSGLDSNVLLQRPDVLSAEHALKAANADIGAARAAFFPSISLTASGGRSSGSLSDLTSGASRTWSFVPSISLPIFQGGALKAELDATKIEKNIQVATYEKAIQTAFSEVADALAERGQLDERLDAQTSLVAATQRSFDLSQARYENGVDSYLVALDSQRSLYSARQDMVTLRLTEAANRVTLYKVLGGGADATAPQ